MNSSFSAARNDESGFTLVELLVVIAIIAILTAIAVPSFLSQRAKANDASVRADMKSVVTTIETALIDETGVISVVTTGDIDNGGAANVTVGTTNIPNVALSKGVTITSIANSSNTRYALTGSHTGGNGPIYYDSANGGFIDDEPTITAAPPLDNH